MSADSLTNDYLSLADFDFEMACANASQNYRAYNHCAVLFQQACEKYLKYLIGVYDLFHRFPGAHSNLRAAMRSHSLTFIYQVLCDCQVPLVVQLSDLRLLEDLYIHARYPGDGFVVVDRNLVLQCEAAARRIREAVRRLLP